MPIPITRPRTTQNAFSARDLTREAKEYCRGKKLQFLHWFVVPTEHGMRLVVGARDNKKSSPTYGEQQTLDILF